MKIILPFLEAIQHDEYREPFVGGGSLFFAKCKAKLNWLNDIDKELMTTYQVIAEFDLRTKLIAMLSQEVATRERHSEIKSMNPSSIQEIAFKTYYLNRTSFSGILNKPAWGYAEGQSAPPENWGRKIELAGKKLEEVRLTALDFEEVILAPKEGKCVLLYLDPPYFESDQKRAYSWSFREEDHRRLESTLQRTDHHFCLSYDDCEAVRRLYSWANIYERSWLYNTANCRGTPRKAGNELIITNYKVKEFTQEKLL
ncbi:MAG: DNA adenine methylase [Thermoplasmata archaeon]|nr:DNA adenine methylase [Thermoplasmata archaeon]